MLCALTHTQFGICGMSNFIFCWQSSHDCSTVFVSWWHFLSSKCLLKLRMHSGFYFIIGVVFARGPSNVVACMLCSHVTYCNEIWDAVLTCNQKLNLLHGTNNYKVEKQKLKSKKTSMLRSISKQFGESMESVLRKTRKASVGGICRKGRF